MANDTRPSQHEDFVVVAIGASAGGIEALQKFFSAVEADSGMAYVVVLHLSPTYESELATVLQRANRIPVEQVSDTVRVMPNHVYVVPPNRSMTMHDGTLTLSPIRSSEERRAPIDIFFRTLADSVGARAAAVILSGSGADGSMGMKRVKEFGGLALVQEPNEAGHSEMPRHCIATGLVDYVLPAAQIAPRIEEYFRQLRSLDVEPAASGHVATAEQMHDGALRLIVTTLRMRTGQDFSHYKRATLLRRVARRTSVRELPDIRSYAEFLRDHNEETQPLLKDLLISVTNFYRDEQAWRTIEQHVLPRVFENKGQDSHVRVWSAGCATGEEAYSIAMLLAEHASIMPEPPTLQVFATDVDEDAVAFAREGIYTLNDAADVSEDRLRRFFTKEGDRYRVRRELREKMLFAHHNLIKDPPFSHLDLATCRNLLIYLNRTGQRRALEVLHFALSPGGYLVLGPSESVDAATDLFVDAGLGAQIYRRRAIEPRMTFPVPDVLPTRQERAGTDILSAERRASERLSFADLHQKLLEEYAPPSLVINDQQDIVHLSPRAGRYLQVTGGEPSPALFKLVRPELRLELRTALHEALQRRISVETRPIAVRRDDGTTEAVTVLVRPVVSEGNTERGYALVVFTPSSEAALPSKPEIVTATTEPLAAQLEEELNRTKAQLRATVEQWEIQTEELRASNEELQAMNEELSSAAEELETRKEELQSVNEELTTVNQELKIKIDELSQIHNDLLNLINSTDIGTIFLDRTLRIKLFTPRARDVYSLIPGDIGRPLADIRTQFTGVDLSSALERVLETLQPFEGELKTLANRVYFVKITPYRTSEDRIDGLVITFVDLTDRRAMELHREQLLEGERAARITAEGATRLKDDFLATLSHEMRTPLSVITSWSQLLESKFATVDPQLRRGLALIGSSAFALSQLISDLLDTARIRSGKLVLDQTTLDLAQVLNAAVQAQRLEADRKSQSLELETSVEAAPIHGDLMRLQQIFWNLISNAIKFTPEHGAIKVKLELDERDYVVTVSDTGQGIAPEFLPRVFERFSQADPLSFGRGAGLGLGLAIVKQLIELHGGSVTAASDGVGKGSTFIVRLPIWSRTVGTRIAAIGDSSSSRAPQLSLTDISVLLVDDSAELLESLSRELQDYGASTEECTSAKQALDLLRANPQRFDVMVADIGMPGMDGYQLAETMRRELGIASETMPAIALTAFEREQDRVRALAAGYQAHVVKPYRISDVVHTIAALVRKREGRAVTAAAEPKKSSRAAKQEKVPRRSNHKKRSPGS